MTQPDDARRMREAAERITRTYFCHSGKHTVSTSIASTLRRGRRVCANCMASIQQQKQRR